MPKKLILAGFQVTPIVHAVDLDTETSEQVPAGDQFVKGGDLVAFATEEWPGHWDRLRQQFDTMQAAQAAIDAGGGVPNPAGPRKARRAAKKASPIRPVGGPGVAD